MVKTQIHMHCSVINQKIKIFCDFRVFVINPIPKNENSEITEIHQKPKILKCEYVTSKTLDMLSKRHQYQNDSATLLIIFEKDFPWFLGFHFENPEKEVRKSQVLQKGHNTEMREFSCNAVQTTSNLKLGGRLLSFECFWPSWHKHCRSVNTVINRSWLLKLNFL